jgi:hypothetical protein
MPKKIKGNRQALSSLSHEDVETKLKDIERQLAWMYEEDSDPVHNLEYILRELVPLIRMLNERLWRL